MLVPTSFQPLTSQESVFMGVTVMGGVVSQLAQAMIQMSHCKFLGFANYTIAKPTRSPIATNIYYLTNWSGLPEGQNKSNKFYSFFYGSTPLSEWIGVIFQYVATKESSTNSPVITFRVKNLSGIFLSKPVQFTYSEHLNMSVDGNLDRPYTATTGATFYDPPIGTSGFDTPRPLYVPSSSRGDMLILEVEAHDCDLVSVSFFDLYQAEITP